MADLTDADKGKFVDDVIAALGANKPRLIAKDWDPTSRIATFTDGVTTIASAQETLETTKQAYESAQSTWRAAFDANYDLASASVGSMEGTLGKEDLAVKALHGARGAMHHASASKKSVPAK